MTAVALSVRTGRAVLAAGPPSSSRPPRLGGTVAAFAPRAVGPVYILGSCASLQTATALATTVFATFGPAGTGALRFLAAAVVLTIFVRPRLRGRTARTWAAITALGVTITATNLLLYEAVARIPLATAGTLVFLGPLALILIRARGRLDLAWTAAAVIGVLLLTGGPTGASPTGTALALGAAVCVAASILISRPVGQQTAGLDGVALSIGIAALMTLPVGLPVAFQATSFYDVVAVAAVGIFGIALPYALEFSALRRVGVKTYSILLSLDPAVAALAGLLLLGQRLAATEILGIALVMIACGGASATQPPGRERVSARSR